MSEGDTQDRLNEYLRSIGVITNTSEKQRHTGIKQAPPKTTVDPTIQRYVNMIRSMGLDPIKVLESSANYEQMNQEFQQAQAPIYSFGRKAQAPQQSFAEYYLKTIGGYDPTQQVPVSQSPIPLFGANGIFKDQKEAAANLGYNKKNSTIGNYVPKPTFGSIDRDGQPMDAASLLRNSVLKLFEQGAQYNNYLSTDDKSLIDNFVTHNKDKGVNPLLSYSDFLAQQRNTISAKTNNGKTIQGKELLGLIDNSQRAGVFNDINNSYGTYVNQYRDAANTFTSQMNQQMQKTQLANETDPALKASQSATASTGNSGWGSVGYSTPAQFLEQRRTGWSQSATQGV